MTKREVAARLAARIADHLPRAMKVELQILDPRLAGWGFPSWGSSLAAGLDLHACLDGPLIVEPQAPAVLIPAGIAFASAIPIGVLWCCRARASAIAKGWCSAMRSG